EDDVALGDLVLRVAGDDLGQRGLAGAVRAHQRVHLTAGHHQVDPLEDLVAAYDAGVKVPDLERLVTHLCTSRWEASRGSLTAPAHGPRTVNRTRSEFHYTSATLRRLSRANRSG